MTLAGGSSVEPWSSTFFKAASTTGLLQNTKFCILLNIISWRVIIDVNATSLSPSTTVSAAFAEALLYTDMSL
jgi:hypothetical protein